MTKTDIHDHANEATKPAVDSTCQPCAPEVYTGAQALAVAHVRGAWSVHEDVGYSDQARLLATERALRKASGEIPVPRSNRPDDLGAPDQGDPENLRIDLKVPGLSCTTSGNTRRSKPSRPPNREARRKSSRAAMEDTVRIAVARVPKSRYSWTLTAGVVALSCLIAWAFVALGLTISHRLQTKPSWRNNEQALATALPATPALPAPERVDVSSAPEALPVVETPSPELGVSLASVRVIRGTTDRRAFVRALRRSVARMELCFKQTQHDRSVLGPRAELTLRLRRDGRLRSVRMESLDRPDNCIVRALKGTRFPQAGTGLLAKAELRLTDASPVQ